MSNRDAAAAALHQVIVGYMNRRLQPVADTATVARQLVSEQAQIIEAQGRLIDALDARVRDLDGRIPPVMRATL